MPSNLQSLIPPKSIHYKWNTQSYLHYQIYPMECLFISLWEHRIFFFRVSNKIILMHLYQNWLDGSRSIWKHWETNRWNHNSKTEGWQNYPKSDLLSQRSLKIPVDLKKERKEREGEIDYMSFKTIMNDFKYSNGIRNITTKSIYPSSAQPKE